MRKVTSLVLAASIFIFTACSTTPAIETGQTPTPTSHSASDIPTPWYQELLDNESTSLTDLSLNGSRDAKRLLERGVIIDDALVQGTYQIQSDSPINPGEKLAITIICQESFAWESALPPIHPEQFGSSQSCSGVTTLISKEIDENIDNWSFTLMPATQTATYRIIVQKQVIDDENL